MIYILHISDLHFVKNAADYNTEEILLREAAEKVKGIPQGKKLLIVTGDFHNFWETDYQRAEKFLKSLVSKMDLDMEQDVFVIPGNHDVGNDTALDPLLSPEDKNWRSHQKSCLKILKDGDKSYIEERLLKFRAYSAFVRNLGIYKSSPDTDYPARSHVRCWRNKLNILHLNTALIADGTKKNDQMTDVDTVADPETWAPYYDEKLPSIAIGHNSFYDILKNQRQDLTTTFALKNVSAYLCGDRHQIERDPEQRTISIQPKKKNDIRIPNLVAAKSIADGDDSYSDVGFCWHYWNEKSDEVNVEFRKWTKNSGAKTEPDGEGLEYDMRHEKPNNHGPKGDPGTNPVKAESFIAENSDADLRRYLAEVLQQKKKSHPSFQLLELDEIDRRLFPNIKKYAQFEPYGKSPANSSNPNEDGCPIWEIISGTWPSPEHRNIVILGEGGIGKTVALFSIAGTSDRSAPVPALYIPMYELVDQDGRLLELDEYITKRYRRYGGRIDALATESWDNLPRLLILLDGFNEIPFSLRRKALYIINEWYDSHPGAQLVAVSRPMDGLNLAQELAGNPLPIELAPLNEDSVRVYLREIHRQIPAKGAPIWEDLRYPLFLNLYAKSRNFKSNHPAGYPLHVLKADSGGALIWNFLQRELLRHRADKSEKAESWVLRCATANEYLLPYLAYHMVSEHQMEISFKQADSWIKEAVDLFDGRNLPKHLAMIRDVYEQNHDQILEATMFSSGIWRDTVLRDSGILVPHKKQNSETGETISSYVFMHQHFRDCLAGLYLVNQGETAIGSELPEVWRHSHNHIVLDYVAELMDDNTVNKLWEINRIKMQYDSPDYINDHSGTFALLELRKRHRPVPEDLNFSGMDLRGISLARYMTKKPDSLPLFKKSHSSYGTMLDRTTFQNEGHLSSITCALALSDGRIVSGSDDNSLRVWDTSDGQCLQVLTGHSAKVTCVEALSDGRIVSGSDDNSLRVWDTSDGRCLQVLAGHSRPVRCVVVLPDGRIVSGSGDHSLRVWDISGGRCLQVLTGHSARITCVEALSDGRIVSGSVDNSLRVWDTSDGQCLQVLTGHSAKVTCVEALSDGRIVSGSDDNSLRIWDISGGRCLQVLIGHSGPVICVEALPDGRIVSGSGDHSLRVWDTSGGQCLQVLAEHSGWVRCVEVLPDGRVVSGSGDHSLRVWDTSDRRCLQVLTGHSGSVTCVAALQDGRIVSGSFDDSLRIWDLSNGRCLQVLNGQSKGIYCVTALPDGRIVSGSDDHSLRIWDTSGGQCLQVLAGHSGWVGCLTVLQDGWVVSGSGDYTLRVWDTLDGRCLQVLTGHSGSVRCVAALPDGRVVSGSYDHSLRVWDTSDGRCLQILAGHSGSVRCVAVLPDGRIVSGSDDNLIKKWNPDTGKCTETFEILEVDVTHLDLSNAILTKDLAGLLWQNGATISKEDFEKYVHV